MENTKGAHIEDQKSPVKVFMSSAVFTGDLSSLKWKMQCVCVKTHSHMARDWHINKNLLDNSTPRGGTSQSVAMAFPKVVTVKTNHN